MGAYVAREVRRPERGPAARGARAPVLQRKCTACAQDDERKLSRRAASGAVARRTAPAIVGETLSAGGGRPLDAATRDHFRRRFDFDFSAVRVHSGARADASARAVDAIAFTVGRDVVFRDGAFSESTARDNRLLAHELAHVVQQGGADARGASPGALAITPANDPSEREADAMADAALRSPGAAPAASSAPRGALQRAIDPEATEEPPRDAAAAATPPEAAPAVSAALASGAATTAQASPEAAATLQKGGEVVHSTARTPEEEPLIRQAGQVPSNTVECIKKWTPCRAPYSPGSWGLRITYHCPKLILPWMIIVPGTTRPAYVTVPDEFIGVDASGRDQYRCRPRSSVSFRASVADSAAFALTRSTLYPGADACHAGFRAFLRVALEAMFLPSGGGRTAGIRVNAPPPPATHPCP